MYQTYATPTPRGRRARRTSGVTTRTATCALLALLALPACAPSIPPPVERATTRAGDPPAKPNPANSDPSLRPSFGPFDVQTVFFINKSDDHNRVDYGMRLDSHCAPVSDKAVFPYWREFEHAPPVRTHPLKFYEYAAYGFAEQRVVEKSSTGGRTLVELKEVTRPILIVTRRSKAGYCAATAYARIQGNPHARLDHIFVKLAGILDVAYVDIHGSDPRTGAKLMERLKH